MLCLVKHYILHGNYFESLNITNMHTHLNYIHYRDIATTYGSGTSITASYFYRYYIHIECQFWMWLLHLVKDIPENSFRSSSTTKYTAQLSIPLTLLS